MVDIAKFKPNTVFISGLKSMIETGKPLRMDMEGQAAGDDQGRAAGNRREAVGEALATVVARSETTKQSRFQNASLSSR